MKAAFSFFSVFPEVARVEVVDVAAMPLDGHDEIYRPLVTAGKAALTAFEPDQAALATLRQSLGPPNRVFPYFIGDGAPGVFHVNSAPMTSSLFPPNDDVLALFPDVAPHVQLQSRHAVTTRRLDDIAEISRIDFLKLDAQGAELDILKGAARHLDQCLAVHTEVEFLPLYRNQPLFADVDMFLRGQGFQFHTFHGLAKRFVAPLHGKPGEPGAVNQVVWADAVYIRDLVTLDRLAPDRRLMLAALVHELYGSVDVALHIVKKLAETGDAAAYGAYVKRLQAGAVT